MNKKILSLIVCFIIVATFFYGLGYFNRPTATSSFLANKHNEQIWSVNPNCTIWGTSKESENFGVFLQKNNTLNLSRLEEFDDFLWLVNYSKPDVIFCDGYTVPNTVIYYFVWYGVTCEYVGVTD
jgi:hypothetical protein